MKVLSVHYARKRKPAYATRTELVEADGKKIVRKVAMTGKAIPFVNGMKFNYEKMVATYGKEHVAHGWLENDGVFCMEFVEGESLEQKAIKYFSQGNYEGFKKVISYFYNRILPNIKEEKTGNKYTNPLAKDRQYNIDMILSNIIINQEGDYKIIDYEWLFPQGSKNFIGVRAMINLYVNDGVS